MKTFAGIDPKYASDKAAVYLQSIPYDGTSTWGKGADRGFDAFIEASVNIEYYDIETDSEVYKKGIHILPEMQNLSSPEKVFNDVYKSTQKLIGNNKLLTFFGGEHSISIGIIKAFYEAYPNITVLQLDAHADLRPEYLGSKYNHACALHDASLNTNLVQVGVRSMDIVEKEFMNPQKCFLAETIIDNNEWVKNALDCMTDDVYITIDLDVLDPSIMPSTGTPEPGGLDWYKTTTFLKEVFKNKNVLGFDMVELAPSKTNKAPDFLAAKLYYKLLSYNFFYKKNETK